MKNYNRSKYTAILAGGLLSLTSSLSANTNPDSFIKQFHTPDGSVTPFVLSTIYFNGPEDGEEASGTKASEQPLINSFQPYYELWTQGIGDDEGMYIVDTATTGPKTILTVVTGDPYSPMPRTRADRLMGIMLETKFEANPIPPEGEVSPPRHVNMETIYYRHTTQVFNSSGAQKNTPISDTEEFIQDRLFTSSDIQSAVTALNPPLDVIFQVGGGSQLPIEDDINYKQRGLDIFRVYAVTNEGNAIVPIAQGKIQVWPIAEGSIELIGYKPYDTITRALPDIKIELKDLYPYSTTYAIIYKGTKENPLSTPQIIRHSRRSLTVNNLEPQKKTINIVATDWESYVPDNGEYTIEIITHTPFEGLAYPTSGEARLAAKDMPISGGLSLYYTAFSVDRTISVIANVITSE